MQLCYLAVSKTKFLGKGIDRKKLSQNIFVIEVKSVLSLPSQHWGWPVAPQSKFADRLDGMPEGIYQVLGKRFDIYPTEQYLNWLCEKILGVYLQQVWFKPEKFCQCPFFELFYLPKYDGCIGPITSQKLVRDFQTWASTIDDREFSISFYQSLRKAFEIASDSGFIIFYYG
ncbi:MAG: hypothetical protein KME17_15840 [Cyanosarcina radialis HA8281-LM2]|jgi:hypothetical protein|nr:hypothetical protein [Cyanosarcina radialis HA8281-LM2]